MLVVHILPDSIPLLYNPYPIQILNQNDGSTVQPIN